MSAFVAEQVIERSAQDVWAYAADILRHAGWMTVTDARIVQGDGTQAGARGRERVRFGPFGWDAEFEVSEAEPGRRIVWKSRPGGPVRLDGHAGPRAHWPSIDQGGHGPDIPAGRWAASRPSWRWRRAPGAACDFAAQDAGSESARPVAGQHVRVD